MQKHVILLILTLLLVFNSGLLKSQDLDSLKNEIQSLKERLERIEKSEQELSLTTDIKEGQTNHNDSTEQNQNNHYHCPLKKKLKKQMMIKIISLIQLSTY